MTILMSNLIRTPGATTVRGNIDWRETNDNAFVATPKMGYLFDTTSAAKSIVLPSATEGVEDGQLIGVGDIAGNASTNNITITCSGAATVMGGASYTISENNQCVTFAYNVGDDDYRIVANSSGGGGDPESFISENVTKTVGSGGDFTTLEEACLWISTLIPVSTTGSAGGGAYARPTITLSLAAGVHLVTDATNNGNLILDGKGLRVWIVGAGIGTSIIRGLDYTFQIKNIEQLYIADFDFDLKTTKFLNIDIVRIGYSFNTDTGNMRFLKTTNASAQVVFDHINDVYWELNINENDVIDLNGLHITHCESFNADLPFPQGVPVANTNLATWINNSSVRFNHLFINQTFRLQNSYLYSLSGDGSITAFTINMYDGATITTNSGLFAVNLNMYENSTVDVAAGNFNSSNGGLLLDGGSLFNVNTGTVTISPASKHAVTVKNGSTANLGSGVLIVDVPTGYKAYDVSNLGRVTHTNPPTVTFSGGELGTTFATTGVDGSVVYDGVTEIPTGGGGGLTWINVATTTNIYASAGNSYIINCNAGSDIEFILPPSPSEGDEVAFFISDNTNGTWITVNTNGNTAEGIVFEGFDRFTATGTYIVYRWDALWDTWARVDLIEPNKGITWRSVSASVSGFTADWGHGYQVDMFERTGDITVTLPEYPLDGEIVAFKYYGTSTASLIINGNGENIDGSSSNLTMTESGTVILVYNYDQGEFVNVMPQPTVPFTWTSYVPDNSMLELAVNNGYIFDGDGTATDGQNVILPAAPADGSRVSINVHGDRKVNIYAYAGSANTIEGVTRSSVPYVIQGDCFVELVYTTSPGLFSPDWLIIRHGVNMTSLTVSGNTYLEIPEVEMYDFYYIRIASSGNIEIFIDSSASLQEREVTFVLYNNSFTGNIYFYYPGTSRPLYCNVSIPIALAAAAEYHRFVLGESSDGSEWYLTHDNCSNLAPLPPSLQT